MGSHLMEMWMVKLNDDIGFSEPEFFPHLKMENHLMHAGDTCLFSDMKLNGQSIVPFGMVGLFYNR